MNKDVLKREISFRKHKIRQLISIDKSLRSKLNNNHTDIIKIETELKNLYNRLKETETDATDYL